MNKKRLAVLIVLLLSLCMTGCSEQGMTASEAEKTIYNDAPVSQNSDKLGQEYFSDRDFDPSFDEASATRLELTDKISISSGGTYILSGQIDDGMIVVDAGKDDKVQLVLDNVSINSEGSAAIYVKQAYKVFITLAEGSSNKLSNGGSFESYDDSSIDAVIYSKDDVTINGSGILAVNSPAGHGIVAKDSLCITGGTFDILAASNGLEGKDNVCIAGGSFAISAEKDGIQADNDDDESKGFAYICGGSFSIDAGDDGISATGYILIEGGEFEISCGGGSVNSQNQRPQGIMQLQPEAMRDGGHGRGPGRNFEQEMPDMGFSGMKAPLDSGDSMRAIKAEGDITVAGGSFVIDAAGDAIHSNKTLTVSDGEAEIFAGDDGLNAESTIIINGGDMRIIAYGDGVDSNGSVEVLGGTVHIFGPLQGDTATLDFESTATIRGGTFLGTGSAMMARTFSSAEQGLLSLSLGQKSAGTEIKVSDKDGNVLISFTPELDFCVAIISCPELIKGESYIVSVADESGEITA